jgi:hypothetical protein
MLPGGPVQQPYARVDFILLVRNYEFGYFCILHVLCTCQSPSADYSQHHSENFGKFLRRLHCKDTMQKNLKQRFLKTKLRSLSSNFHIQVSVSDLYIPTLGLPILVQENMWTDPGNI